MLHDHLTEEERHRADRYQVQRPRQQFITTRGMLRVILGKMLGRNPAQVAIGYSGVGKPILLDRSDALHFNVSHSHELALIALSLREVGVDLERLRPIENEEALVARFFSAHEHHQYLGLQLLRRNAAFFRGWTSKEALIKAVGSSATYLDSFDVEMDPDRPARLLSTRHPALMGSSWSMFAWLPHEGYAATVALRGDYAIVLGDSAR
jgi:4'-phosphopantetheinyl transferase